MVSDDEQTVYWSWHLWFTDYEPSKSTDAERKGQIHQYISDAFQPGGTYENKSMMDRNLGATITGITGAINQPKTTAEAVKYYGLMYQFGRKDPFVGSRDGTDNNFVRRYDANGTEIKTLQTAAGTTGTDSKLAYAVNNPLVFLTKGTGNWTTEKDGLWGEDGTKSVFDPCPPGWRVPLGGPDAKNNPWAGFRTGISSETDSGDSAWDGFAWKTSSVTGAAGRLYKNSGVQAWYPASGTIYFTSGKLAFIGTNSPYWGAIPNDLSSSYYLDFTDSYVYPIACFYRAYSFPVRCVQE